MTRKAGILHTVGGGQWLVPDAEHARRVISGVAWVDAFALTRLAADALRSHQLEALPATTRPVTVHTRTVVAVEDVDEERAAQTRRSPVPRRELTGNPSLPGRTTKEGR